MLIFLAILSLASAASLHDHRFTQILPSSVQYQTQLTQPIQLVQVRPAQTLLGLGDTVQYVGQSHYGLEPNRQRYSILSVEPKQSVQNIQTNGQQLVLTSVQPNIQQYSIQALQPNHQQLPLLSVQQNDERVVVQEIQPNDQQVIVRDAQPNDQRVVIRDVQPNDQRVVISNTQQNDQRVVMQELQPNDQRVIIRDVQPNDQRVVIRDRDNQNNDQRVVMQEIKPNDQRIIMRAVQPIEAQRTVISQLPLQQNKQVLTLVEADSPRNQLQNVRIESSVQPLQYSNLVQPVQYRSPFSSSVHSGSIVGDLREVGRGGTQYSYFVRGSDLENQEIVNQVSQPLQYSSVPQVSSVFVQPPKYVNVRGVVNPQVRISYSNVNSDPRVVSQSVQDY